MTKGRSVSLAECEWRSKARKTKTVPTASSPKAAATTSRRHPIRPSMALRRARLPTLARWRAPHRVPQGKVARVHLATPLSVGSVSFRYLRGVGVPWLGNPDGADGEGSSGRGAPDAGSSGAGGSAGGPAAADPAGDPRGGCRRVWHRWCCRLRPGFAVVDYRNVSDGGGLADRARRFGARTRPFGEHRALRDCSGADERWARYRPRPEWTIPGGVDVSRRGRALVDQERVGDPGRAAGHGYRVRGRSVAGRDTAGGPRHRRRRT